MQNDSGQEPEQQIENAEGQCGNDEFHQPGIGGLSRVVRMPGPEDDRFEDQSAPDPVFDVASETPAEQHGSRQRDRAKQTFLPKAGLQGSGDRIQPREVSGQCVGLNECV